MATLYPNSWNIKLNWPHWYQFGSNMALIILNHLLIRLLVLIFIVNSMNGTKCCLILLHRTMELTLASLSRCVRSCLLLLNWIRRSLRFVANNSLHNLLQLNIPVAVKINHVLSKYNASGSSISSTRMLKLKFNFQSN